MLVDLFHGLISVVAFTRKTEDVRIAVIIKRVLLKILPGHDSQAACALQV